MHTLRPVYLDEEHFATGPSVAILDQTQLPHTHITLYLTELNLIYEAIKSLRVRGAPAIGIAAALGIYVHMKHTAPANIDAFISAFESARAYLASSRPTAVNLTWALNRMAGTIKDHASTTVPNILLALRETALAILNEDTNVCRSIGEHGAQLLKPGMGILTHCNAGTLAASQYGTALAPIYIAHERGMSLRVYADETRPLLQGARLTAYELRMAGVDTTLICDNMAADVMQKGLVDIVFVGCDRVAANGDTANKIGTLGVAILAKNFNIPCYVCVPFSTIDTQTITGADIEIEQRNPREVTQMWYEKDMAPKNVKVYNPAFDVTPAAYITGYITENGVLKPPF